MWVQNVSLSLENMMSNYHVRLQLYMMRHFANFVYEITKQKILNNEAINPLLEDSMIWVIGIMRASEELFCLYEQNGLACVGFERDPHLFISLNFNNSWPNMRQFGPRVEFFSLALLHWIIFASSESKSNFANETHSFSFLSVLLHFSAFSLYLSRRI